MQEPSPIADAAPPRVLILSTSLSEESRSAILAAEAFRCLDDAGHPVSLLDLRGLPLPICDGGKAYSAPEVTEAAAAVEESDAILVAGPIYNYDLSAAAKNFIELTGRSWQEKCVGFAVAAGGRSSYMAPLGLANSLMVDFRCQILPRFVYATGEDFEGDRIVNEELLRRLGLLMLELRRLAWGRALASRLR